MLLDILVNKLKTKFPSTTFTVDWENKFLQIPAEHEKIGNIEVIDDEFELTIMVGNFTHWHASCYDDDLTSEEKSIEIVDAVLEFLDSLFKDEIVLWGTHDSFGGFYYKNEPEEEQDTPLMGENVDKFVWSGREIS